MCARANLGVHEDGRPGFSMPHRRRDQAAFLETTYVLVGSSRLDDAGSGLIEGSFGEPVIGMHPLLEVGQDASGQEVHRCVAHPVARGIVGVGVVAGRGNNMNPGRFGDGPHAGRPSPQADRRHLHDRLQPAAFCLIDLFDRAARVVEILTW